MPSNAAWALLNSEHHSVFVPILNEHAVLRQRRATFFFFFFEAIWGNFFFLFYKGFYIRHQIVMRNVAVLFITGERLRAEIFIDTVRTFKGLKSSEESEDRLHLQEEDSSSPKE